MPEPITPTSFTRATLVVADYFAKPWLGAHLEFTRYR